MKWSRLPQAPDIFGCQTFLHCPDGYVFYCFGKKHDIYVLFVIGKLWTLQGHLCSRDHPSFRIWKTRWIPWNGRYVTHVGRHLCFFPPAPWPFFRGKQGLPDGRRRSGPCVLPLPEMRSSKCLSRLIASRGDVNKCITNVRDPSYNGTSLIDVARQKGHSECYNAFVYSNLRWVQSNLILRLLRRYADCTPASYSPPFPVTSWMKLTIFFAR